MRVPHEQFGLQREGHLNELGAVVGPRTALTSLEGANNETGVIQPLEEVSAVAVRKARVLS